ncbi:tetratricopeptide repeat-containing glycosyltransferase family 2 protein [Desulfosporosinus shakirovi]|uniref:tetratricopeptide repeat-containing glycosyltransferase family 2 protein n=1 Tax=Desulfosporosinus shakirovi TaxID=2885154 RepID=UPI001E4D2493|nr:glycosyltransferase family 2 protein [Desulfosporosinus sp. SRJS8]MCB8818115.1 glycosyltransferase family 2 protein [Desulfosporosinus sp. SRJS8]
MLDHSITISLCMIVRNEEDTIARCLDSIKGIPDEIIIVDTGSTDRTKEIVKEFTHNIFDFIWIDDFATARNFAFSKATKDYILWLDADDIFSDSDREQFLKLKIDLNPLVDAVNMPYLLGFDQFGEVTFSLRRNRLVKRSKNFRWIGAVHEYLEVYGSILNSDICVTHKDMGRNDSARNLKIYEKRKAKGEQFSPRDLYYYANELLDHKLYEQAIEFYEKFLKTGQGWVEDNISTCGKLADCYQKLNNTDKQLKYIFKSFEYANPRAEFCCRLGFYFLSVQQYEKGVFWYKLATQLEKPIDSWGPIIEACWTWLPHLQLCVCYDRLGEHQLAYKHNEIARKYRPENTQVLYNKKYLEGVLKNEKVINNNLAQNIEER